jgi:hypothetical protein
MKKGGRKPNKPNVWRNNWKHNASARPHLPDLREWWLSVAKYEGQKAKKRPASLVIP